MELKAHIATHFFTQIVNITFVLSAAIADPSQKNVWSVSLHASDVHYDLKEARRALDQIRDLGATMVRTDFDWWKLEPVRGVWDPSAIQFFNDYINEARTRGIEVIAILFHPPKWALKLYQKGRRKVFLNAYFHYSKKVASLYGDRLTYYQYWNEPNNGFTNPIQSKDNWRVILTADQAVRSASRRPYHGMVNYLVDLLNRSTWERQLEDTFRRIHQEDPQHTIRTIGIDLYPGTWSFNDAFGWAPLDDLERALADPGHPCYGYDAAVMETGYSQVLPAPWDDLVRRNESEQAEWFANSIPYLYKKLTAPGSKYLFVNLYELYDMPSNRFLDPEARFGIFRANHRPKKAAFTIQNLLTTLSSTISKPIPTSAQE